MEQVKYANRSMPMCCITSRMHSAAFKSVPSLGGLTRGRVLRLRHEYSSSMVFSQRMSCRLAFYEIPFSISIRTDLVPWRGPTGIFDKYRGVFDRMVINKGQLVSQALITPKISPAFLYATFRPVSACLWLPMQLGLNALYCCKQYLCPNLSANRI